jgi:SRSO17 transposase
MDASMEVSLAFWEQHLQSLHQRISPRFARAEPRQRVLAYLKGLASPCERKNGWQLAEMTGEATPDGVQRLLNQALWDADAVRDDLRAYVVEHLGDEQGVLVIDETGFVKKGSKSVGVQRQYSGTAGRIENCQVGVFLTYTGSHGSAFLDRALYLPQEWAGDMERRVEAGVPEAVEFATKPELARQMLQRALAGGVPCGWVTGDSIYGGDRKLRMWLEGREQPFVLAVPKNEPLWGEGHRQVRADKMVALLTEDDWQRLSAGDGSKGPRLYDWAWQKVHRLQLTPQELRFGHWLLVRRSVEDPKELAYYVVFGPADTTLAELARVAGSRWSIEACFEAAKGEFGLDQYEDECTRCGAGMRGIGLSHWCCWPTLS